MKSKEKNYVAAYWQKWRAENRPKKIKPCEKCGVLFYPYGRQKRCEDCRTLFCEYCKRKFIPPNSMLNRRFCSRECKDNAQRGAEPAGLKNNRGRKPRTYHLTKRDKHGNAFDREWREFVFKRDNYTCQECKQKGGRLEAHHIKPYKECPELRHDINNGITLCKECHSKTDSYGWANYWKNYKKEIAAKRIESENRQYKMF